MRKIGFWVIWTLLWGVASHTCYARSVTVTDAGGRKVEAPFDAERIICIGPGALRLIVYLDAQSKVVGVEDLEIMNPRGRPYWIAQPELWDLPRCGPGGPVSINKKPDLEAVLSVSPQVIFVTYMEASLANEVQKILNIPVIVLDYGGFATFDEKIYDSLRMAGIVLNRAQRAEAVVNYVESLREDLAVRTRDIPLDQKVRVYAGGIGFRGTQGLGSTEQRYVPFDWVQAKNVAEDLKAGGSGSHVFVDRETLLKLNPDVIFIDGGGLSLVTEEYRKNPAYHLALKAFAKQRVYTLLPFNWYVTNIGTALADAYAVGKILYPDRFKDIHPEQKADEIYTFLVGRPVYEQMKTTYGAIGQKAPFLN